MTGRKKQRWVPSNAELDERKAEQAAQAEGDGGGFLSRVARKLHLRGDVAEAKQVRAADRSASSTKAPSPGKLRLDAATSRARSAGRESKRQAQREVRISPEIRRAYADGYRRNPDRDDAH